MCYKITVKQKTQHIYIYIYIYIYITAITISTHLYSTFLKISIHSLMKIENTVSLKFVNERVVQNIIGDNSDVDASDRDIDFSHAITESDENFDSEDEEPLSKHMALALNNTSADASNASNAVDFDSEDEAPISKHEPSS